MIIKIFGKEVTVTEELLDKLKFCKNCDFKKDGPRDITGKSYLGYRTCEHCINHNQSFFEKHVSEIN